MVNMRASSHTLEGTNGSGDTNSLAELRVAMDDLCLYKQILENEVHNIVQRQQDSNAP